MSIDILLSNGMIALIDEGDAHLASLKWSASVVKRNGKQRVYASREKAGQRFYLHREVMGNPAGDVDHRDADNTLDCRRSNLRLATRSQNNANGRKRIGTSSRFKGVFFHAQTGKWCAQICNAGQKQHLGLFREESDAAMAYNLKAHELFGEFARFNIA